MEDKMPKGSKKSAKGGSKRAVAKDVRPVETKRGQTKVAGRGRRGE
jgi:hypothetical protein